MAGGWRKDKHTGKRDITTGVDAKKTMKKNQIIERN